MLEDDEEDEVSRPQEKIEEVESCGNVLETEKSAGKQQTGDPVVEKVKKEQMQEIQKFAEANGFDLTIDDDEDEYEVAARFKITKEILDKQ